jgi:hypothetical protein
MSVIPHQEIGEGPDQGITRLTALPLRDVSCAAAGG